PAALLGWDRRMWGWASAATGRLDRPGLPGVGPAKPSSNPRPRPTTGGGDLTPCAAGFLLLLPPAGAGCLLPALRDVPCRCCPSPACATCERRAGAAGDD